MVPCLKRDVSSSHSDVAIMSLPASKLELESPRNNLVTGEGSDEHEILHNLAGVPPQEPIIAVDLDDVLSQTNKKVAQCEPH